jgi:hypothetical protein
LKHSSWLVVLGSTAFVACSIYTSDLLVQDDTLKPRPSASVTGPTASAARTDAPNPSMGPGTSGTSPDSSTDSSSKPSSGASADPTTTDPGDGGPPDPSSEPSIEADGGPASSSEPSSMPSSPASSMAVPSATPPPDPAIIDDFEDGNNRILLRGGRTGYWFTSASDPADDTFTITDATKPTTWVLAPDPAGDANDTKKAAHVVATGISDDITSHAEVGVNFINPPSGESNVEYPEAAGYLGIAFRARIGEDAYDDAADNEQWIRFALPLSTTEADSDHYTKDFLVTEEWTEYFVQWADADFIQQGFGEAVEFDAAKATALQFKLINPATGFDLWVDDIRFIEAP